MTAFRAVGPALREWLTASVPPHIYALLRISLGLVGLLRLAGLTPIELHWAADGIVPLSGGGTGLRQWVVAQGLGTAAGGGLYALLLASSAAMVAGYKSNWAVLATYLGLLAENSWNSLPLSSAHPAMMGVMFCLVWAESGRVWSWDARRHGPNSSPVNAWPLRLIRWQVAVIYFASGLWKVVSPAWRDGSAVHWAINVNTFHRFPGILPPDAAPILAAATWGTLLFELGFPLLVLSARGRRLAIWLGVGMHVGLGLVLELGIFSWVMLATYVVWLDPWRIGPVPPDA